jgi:hypothetical protein
MNVRTFGDLITARYLHADVACRFCKTLGARKYSVRHYICDACASLRADVVLPKVLKREARRAHFAAANA